MPNPTEPGSRHTALASDPTLPLTSFMTSGRSLQFSEPQFPQMSNCKNHSDFTGCYGSAQDSGWHMTCWNRARPSPFPPLPPKASIEQPRPAAVFKNEVHLRAVQERRSDACLRIVCYFPQPSLEAILTYACFGREGKAQIHKANL